VLHSNSLFEKFVEMYQLCKPTVVAI